MLCDIGAHESESSTDSSGAMEEGFADGTRGLFQAIGGKEFKRYLRLRRDAAALGTTAPEAEVQQAIAEGVQLLKQHTRRYARRQISYISNRLRARSDIWRLDTSEPSKWNEHVYDAALRLVQSTSAWQAHSHPQLCGKH